MYGIYNDLYIWLILMIHVSVNIPYMDPMGREKFQFPGFPQSLSGVQLLNEHVLGNPVPGSKPAFGTEVLPTVSFLSNVKSPTCWNSRVSVVT